MATTTLPGQFNSARHEPFEPLVFRAMDLDEAMTLGYWRTESIYVHDMRVANGAAASAAAACEAVTALQADLQQPNAKAHISQRLLMWPDGREGAPHCVGGGWSVNRCTFYIVQCDRTKLKYLCVKVYGTKTA